MDEETPRRLARRLLWGVPTRLRSYEAAGPTPYLRPEWGGWLDYARAHRLKAVARGYKTS
jgi:hypothetical protein